MNTEAAREKGEVYVLERIRAGELASRAPDDSPHREWDETGEPYLALDAVIAAGPRMTDADRATLAERLLRRQFRGVWGYRSGKRPDVDTTAAALRALDRLGHRVGLEGMRLYFYRPRTQLFITFPGSEDRLALLPQSRERHFCAHPDVLPNVWLLLHERGEAGCLPPERLAPMQRADGGWHCYHYTSPHYATRLFSELLSALGREYDPALERSLASLLAAEPQSAAQHAEVLIGLAHLARRFPERNLRGHAERLLQRVQDTQLADGSWPGDVIWTFVHPREPGTVVAFDHLRVHSTSLCVRALRLWR